MLLGQLPDAGGDQLGLRGRAAGAVERERDGDGVVGLEGPLEHGLDPGEVERAAAEAARHRGRRDGALQAHDGDHAAGLPEGGAHAVTGGLRRVLQVGHEGTHGPDGSGRVRQSGIAAAQGASGEPGKLRVTVHTSVSTPTVIHRYLFCGIAGTVNPTLRPSQPSHSQTSIAPAG